MLFAGPLKPSTLAPWAEVAPKGAIGLVAPFVFTHRKPPAGAKLWSHDETTGDFRVGVTSRDAIAPFREAIDALAACCAVFRSPEQFSPSAANREALQRFFGELATAEAIGVERVWAPGALWEVPTAVKLANELGVTCALDPLVHEPGETVDPYADLDARALYFRVASLGRAGAIRNEQLEDLAALIEAYEDRRLGIAFASPERWHDAKNLKKLLDEPET